MLQIIDEYKTLSEPSPEEIFKDKGSKFLGYAFPITSEDEVNPIILSLKEKHHKARHWCYAWKLGLKNDAFRANDDGEPNNSAGQPIYGQILSFELTNVLVVVVRYFGGTKLGVGGLINAYKTAAKLALESSKISIKTVDVRYSILFDYVNMNKVMRIIKDNKINIESQLLEMNCEFIISIRKKDAEKIKQFFLDLRSVKIEEI